MIDAKALLDNLKRLRKRLEDDLRERADTVEELHAALQREYREAREAGRTGEAFEVWREGMLTQAAVAWLIAESLPAARLSSTSTAARAAAALVTPRTA